MFSLLAGQVAGPICLLRSASEIDPCNFFLKGIFDNDHKIVHNPLLVFTCGFNIPRLVFTCGFNIPLLVFTCGFNIPLLVFTCGFNIPLVCWDPFSTAPVFTAETMFYYTQIYFLMVAEIGIFCHTELSILRLLPRYNGWISFFFVCFLVCILVSILPQGDSNHELSDDTICYNPSHNVLRQVPFSYKFTLVLL